MTAALRRRGLRAPSVRVVPAVRGTWLQKPRSSGGGRGVRRVRHGERVPGRAYLQEYVEGTPGSVVFLACGGNAVPIGLSRQIVGDQAFGAAGFQYCGSILAAAGDAQFDRDAALVRTAGAMAHAAAEEFGLVGVNGIDFIARDGIPFAIEINPRWSASVELVELAYEFSVFAAHAAACRNGRLPVFDLQAARRTAPAMGKAIVFARRDVTVGDTRPWLSNTGVRDVPRPGERISAGRPVCTVFARGKDSTACYAALVRRAASVYSHLAGWERNVA
jgi:predicted ATP-grasp superfamily ATP-dependent carboligase